MANKKDEAKEELIENKDSSLEKKAKPNPYATNGFISNIPYSIKAIFIKYWFFGAVCFFVGMGLGLRGDLYALVAGLVSGSLIDIACDNILIMMDSDKNESRNYMIFKSKKVWSLFINIAYAIVIYFATAYFCDYMVSLIYREDSFILSSLFAGPLSQGLVALVFDLICIGIKDLIVYLIKKNKVKEN